VTELPQSLPALIEQSAHGFGERLAIIDGATRLSYRELAALVGRTTRALIASGVRPGDRVSVWSPNTFHWIAAALGAHGAGATLVPLNTRFTGAEAHDILSRTATRVLFVPDRFLGKDYLETLRNADSAVARAGQPVDALASIELVVQIPVEGRSGARADDPHVVTWEQLLARADTDTHSTPSVSGEDVSDFLFTSGTTGRPKGAMSSHRQTIAVAAAWAERARVTTRDVYLIINPFFHSFGYKAGWVVSLLRGATIVPQLKFDVDLALATVERERVTILPGPPTLFHSLLAHPRRADYDLSSLRLAVTGSAPVPIALVDRMREELTFEEIITAYGLSEAVVVTMCRPGDDPETISRTSGCATADFELRIADDGGRTLGPGEDGEIQLRGPNVMLGYLDDPSATEAAFTADGWFKTGDVGHLDQRHYLTITDRLKDMYTCGGFNVYPAEVENALLRLDAVVECAVVGYPDERLGEVGLAFVVTDGAQQLREDEVIEHCRGLLANFKVPRRVVFLDELPHSAAGKVLKRELREALDDERHPLTAADAHRLEPDRRIPRA
jgi:acyl-CoA synthetase (AMP-forming)/AMP-acid ligase II